MAFIRRSRAVLLLVLLAVALFMLKPSSKGPSAKSATGRRLKHTSGNFDPAEFDADAEDLETPHQRLGLNIIPVDPDAPFDAAVAWHNILNEAPFSPVVIVSKSYCPHSARAKKILLEKYEINPAPRVIELDQHPHGAELQAHIAEVSGRRTVPNVFVLHETRGGGDEMAQLDLSNTLVTSFREWSNGLLTIENLN